MFEFDKYEKRLHRTQPHIPDQRYEWAANIDKTSLLVWGEHCIECAAPACYSNCDLYHQRPDLRCRRFEYGVYKNRAFRSFKGYGAEVSFKKWAKLEARGNTRMMPVKRVRLIEELIERLTPVGNVIGKWMRRITRDDRWAYLDHSLLVERLGHYLHRGGATRTPPDAFLLEVYNPGEASVNMQVMISLSRTADPGISQIEQLQTMFRRTVALPTGYSRHEIDASAFKDVTESQRPFDIALTPEDGANPTLVILTADFVAYRSKKTRAENKTPDVKCVVFDLDNTLWDGVLLENEKVELRPGILELIKTLDARGVLLSVVSKNSHDHAWERLRQLEVADYFLYPQINWQPKGANVRNIAKQLNIGLDTFAFVDDNPFELDEVGNMLPMVERINAAEIAGIVDNPRFKGSGSADAKNRRLYYRQAIEREQDETQFGEDYFGFLKSCDIRLTIDRYEPKYLERVSELVQRTNQLNFSGHKYSRDEVNRLLADSERDSYVLTCEDKYGSYGIIGFSFVVAGADELRVEDFMLSCRVQGKFIEQAFFDYLQRRQNPHKATRLWVNYRQTERNQPARQVLLSLQFETLVQDKGMALDLTTHDLSCDFIAVNQEPGDSGDATPRGVASASRSV